MVWLNTGATHKHVQLRPLDKVCATKGDSSVERCLIVYFIGKIWFRGTTK